jgi:signal transduction histidine kinase
MRKVRMQSASPPRSKVWVLEDSALEAEMARRALAPAHDVELFVDGATLLERLANGSPPDALILDWQLPGLSGLEVCQFLREQHDEMALPILMVTVQGRKEEVIEGLSAGANDYLAKPYVVAELRARVDALVRVSRLFRVQRDRSRQLALAANVGAFLTGGGGQTGAAGGDFPAVVARCLGALADALEADAAELWSGALGASTEGASTEGALRRMAAHGRAIRDDVVIAALERAERTHGDAGDETRAEPGFVARPLYVEERLVGVLVVSRARPLEKSDLDMLDTVEDLFALGLERARVDAERVALLESERAARRDAEAANRAKDEFLAVVSHELRTPLNAILGWTSLLLQNDGSDDLGTTRRALETVERNARAQTQLIDDLLDISRIISGKLRLHVQRVALAPVVDAAVDAVRFAAESKGVHLEADLRGLAVEVTGDAERIQQVVWNLLANAIKFTPPGGRVVVRVEPRPKEVVIRVEDTGSGIPEAFLPYVFDRFRQADSSPTRAKGGLGLGLAIVRHLVELHGGSVYAESDGEGKGATFGVSLPRAALAPAVLPRALSVAPIEASSDLAGLRVLVVDDELDGREMLGEMLRRHGVEVAAAGSAAEAYELFRASPPDVLVSDLGMPTEDGLSLIRRIRELETNAGFAAKTPALALTAYTRKEDRARALAAGFTMYASKPFEPGELLVVLAKLSGRLETVVGI